MECGSGGYGGEITNTKALLKTNYLYNNACTRHQMIVNKKSSGGMSYFL